MEEQVIRWFEEVGELVSNQSLTRGVLVVSAAVLTITLATWKGLRRKKPDRAIISVNAPSGEHVKIEVGKEIVQQ